MAGVFVSFATPDLPIAVEVVAWLRAEGHDPFLDRDLRSGIRIGEDWKERLYRELRQVDAVVSIVSSASIASSWCSAEIGIADALGCRLLPLRAEAGVVHPLMERQQYADYTVSAETARARLVMALRVLNGSDGRPGWRDGDNPYPGLEPFTSSLSTLFFGRAAEVRDIANRLRAKGGSQGEILAIVGPSGCGKSSLLNAGLLPLLESEPRWLALPPCEFGTEPVAGLARALTSRARLLGLDWSVGEVRARLDEDRGLGRLADELLTASPRAEARHLVIPVDQAEELFTRTGSAGRSHVAGLLGDAVGGPVHVVATMRSEFLDDLRTLPELLSVPVQTYLLAPLGRDMLRTAVEEPARIAGLRLERELVAQMIDDTGSGEALPLLAFALQQLADGMRRGDVLTVAGYHRLGGVHAALTRHADAALATAVTATGLAERQILTGLARLVTIDTQGRRARRRISKDTLPESLVSAMDIFVERRLLVVDNDEAGVGISVAHESLLTSWRPLDAVIGERTTALRAARAVEQAAADWRRAGEPDHYLWDERRFTATVANLGLPAEDHVGTPAAATVDLDLDGHAFLGATRRRIAETHRRERRRRNWTVTVLSVLVVLSLAAAGLAVWQQRIARDRERAATARNMVAQAEAARLSDPRTAMRLGAAAYRLDPSAEAEASLLQTLTTTPYIGRLEPDAGWLTDLSFSRDGTLLAVASGDPVHHRGVLLWDVTDPHRPRTLPALTDNNAGEVLSVAFAPDGRTVAAGSGDSAVLWDVTDRQRPRLSARWVVGEQWVRSLAVTPDGRTLVAASGGTVSVWDIADRARPRLLARPLSGQDGNVKAVDLSPDGDTLAATSGRTAFLWDLTTRARPRLLARVAGTPSAALYSVAFSPDGRTLAAGAEQTAFLWDLTAHDRPRALGQPLVGHTRIVAGVAFSTDGRTLVTASQDGSLRLWDVRDRDQAHQVGQPLTGHAGILNAVAFAPDGHTIVSVSNDGTAVLWDVAATGQPRPDGPARKAYNDSIAEVVFGAGGRTLTINGDGVFQWNVATHHSYRLALSGPVPNDLGSPAVTPDGATAAIDNQDGSVSLWDVADAHHPRALGAPLRGFGSILKATAFAPDGRTLAIAASQVAGDDSVHLFTLDDRQHPQAVGPPLVGSGSPLYTLAFAPDGRTLLVGSSQKAVLWNIADREHPRAFGRSLGTDTNAVYSAAFTPDGRTLVTADNVGIVRLWDIANRARPRTLGPPLTDEFVGVNSVAVAPDGRTLTAVSNGAVVLWDLTERDNPRRLGQNLTDPAINVERIAIAPDGSTLAAIGDGKVIMWDLAALARLRKNVVGDACVRAGGPLSEDLWATVAPGFPYVNSCRP